MSFFVLLDIKEDILKNVCNHTVNGTQSWPRSGPHLVHVESTVLLSGKPLISIVEKKILWMSMATINQHSSKYLILGSAEEKNSYRFGTTQE